MRQSISRILPCLIAALATDSPHREVLRRRSNQPHDDGARIVQWPCLDIDSQRFVFTSGELDNQWGSRSGAGSAAPYAHGSTRDAQSVTLSHSHWISASPRQTPGSSNCPRRCTSMARPTL